MEHGEAGHGAGQDDVEAVQASGLGRHDLGRFHHDDVVVLEAFGECRWQHGDPRVRSGVRLLVRCTHIDACGAQGRYQRRRHDVGRDHGDGPLEGQGGPHFDHSGRGYVHNGLYGEETVAPEGNRLGYGHVEGWQ